MMNILTPLNDEALLEDYISLGANEFYLGFYDDDWIEKFGGLSDINRMSGFGRLANKNSFEETLSIVKRIKETGKKAFVTLNANCYSIAQYEYIFEKYVPLIKVSGADGIIVSDIETARRTAKSGIFTVASTMCAVYNQNIANEYINAGVGRIILPRDLSLSEIESIISACPGVEYEVFFMRNGCIYSDSYCLGMHRPELGATCAFSRFKKINAFSDGKDFDSVLCEDVNNYLYNAVFHHEACGMCALYRLMKAGVTSLKIVGRADDTEGIKRDISLTVKNIRVAAECRNEAEYLEKMQFADNYPKKCRFGLSCYYPEVRFKAEDK